MALIARINRFPVKALSAESLSDVTLTRGYGLPFDRRFALAPAPFGTAPSAAWPWQPPDRFLTLKRYSRLAALKFQLDDQTGLAGISVASDGHGTAPDRIDADILTEDGRASISRFIELVLRGPAPPDPAPPDRVPHDQDLSVTMVDGGAGRPLTDRETPFVSIINQASVDAIRSDQSNDGDVTDRIKEDGLDPTRFRGNLVVDGWAPWAETTLIGRHLNLGTTRLRVVEPIGRCAATHVNPETAHRDRNILKSLKTQFGHTNCGVYAVVEKTGEVTVGDPVIAE